MFSPHTIGTVNRLQSFRTILKIIHWRNSLVYGICWYLVFVDELRKLKHCLHISVSFTIKDKRNATKEKIKTLRGGKCKVTRQLFKRNFYQQSASCTCDDGNYWVVFLVFHEKRMSWHFIGAISLIEQRTHPTGPQNCVRQQRCHRAISWSCNRMTSINDLFRSFTNTNDS